MDSGNRRKWRRLEHALKVELRVVGGREIYQAMGSHLSPEGIFVTLAEPPSPDTKVRVTIGGGGAEDVNVDADGVVINQFAPSDTTDVSGVAIRLIDPGASWRMLYELLAGD